MLKIIGINGSPRSGWNTDLMIKSALKGAASVGAETTLVELGKLNFKPCMSCLACKKSKMESPKCYLKDDLSPILDSILKADGIILGAPIYFGQPSVLYQMFWERLRFSSFAYDPKRMNIFGRQIKSALMFTMNVSREVEGQANYQQLYDKWIGETKAVFGSSNKFIRANNTQ